MSVPDSSESPTPGTPRKSLGDWGSDSALIVAGGAAFCYWVGYHVQAGDAARLGLPLHLLPASSTESVLALGFLSGTLLAMFVAVGYLAAIAAARVLLPANVRAAGAGRLRAAFAGHPRFYSVLFVLTGVVLSTYGARRMATLFPWRYADDRLPVVTKLSLKSDSASGATRDGLRFLARSDAFLVLKRDGAEEFVVVAQENLAILEMRKPPAAPAVPKN